MKNVVDRLRVDAKCVENSQQLFGVTQGIRSLTYNICKNSEMSISAGCTYQEHINFYQEFVRIPSKCN